MKKLSDVMEEALKRTTFGKLNIGDKFERPGEQGTNEKVSDTAFQHVKLTTGKAGGKRYKMKPGTEVMTK